MTRKPVVADYYIVLTMADPDIQIGREGWGGGGGGESLFTIADNLEPLLRCIHDNIDEEGRKR